MKRALPMGRRRQLDPRQADFMGLLEGVVDLPAAPAASPAPSCDFDQVLRRLLNQAIAAGPFESRADLAEAVSLHAGRPVTKVMIDSWTGASRPHRLPADLIPAFCRALGNTILLSGIATETGCALTESAELIRARFDRLALFIRFARAEQRRLIAETPLFQEMSR